jgi:hypothetical protein
MNKLISPKIMVRVPHHITALTFGVLVISFAIAFYVVAWQEPTQAPPQGNVDAPINVGTEPQAKAGRISATEFYDYNDPNYYLNPSGQSALNTLCFGSECRSGWPASQDAWIGADCAGAGSYQGYPEWPPLNVSGCPSGYTESAYYDRNNLPSGDGYWPWGLAYDDTLSAEASSGSYEWVLPVCDVLILSVLDSVGGSTVTTGWETYYYRCHCAYRICEK